METIIKELIEDLFEGNDDGGMVGNIVDGISYKGNSGSFHNKINQYVYVNCNTGNENSIWIEIPFCEITENTEFDRSLEELQETTESELEFWTETNSLNRGSLKNLAIELLINFFSDGFDIDLDSKELINLCKWKSMYRE